VDIHVPGHLKEKYTEMCPIFKKTEISHDDIAEFMKVYAEEHNIMTQPYRSLIGSMKGKKILLATSLLKWYLEHGLDVMKVHQVIEFTPKPCFKLFGDAVSDVRRAGDADPNKAIIADTMKLVRCFVAGNKGWEGKQCHSGKLLKCCCCVFLFYFKCGNSAYGKCITNQITHPNVEYCSDAEASRKVNTPLFRKLENVTKNTYEVESSKKVIKLNLPIEAGFFCVTFYETLHAAVLF